MRHYGDRPPWDGESHYGFWRLIPPDARSFFEEERAYWQWYPPRTTTQRVISSIMNYYLPVIQREFNKTSIFTQILEAEKAAKAAA